MGHTTTTRLGVGLLAPSLLSVLALTGCTGSADPAEPPPPPTTRTTPSPNPATGPATGLATATATGPATGPASPAPTPPAMPPAAKAHTKAGAKAFVKHFWNVVNYAQTTGDTKLLAALGARGCTRCDAGISSIRRVYGAGGRIVGGESSLSNFHTTLREDGDTSFATSTYTNLIAGQTSDYPGSAKDQHAGPRTFLDRITLIAPGDSVWSVAAFEVVS